MDEHEADWFCPHCNSAWTFDEWESQHCGCCGWPYPEAQYDEDDGYLDFDDYDDEPGNYWVFVDPPYSDEWSEG